MASSQNRPSTRTQVARTASTAPVLLATADDAAAAMVSVHNATAPTRAVLGVGDVQWGATPLGLAAVPGPPAGAPAGFPTTLVEDASTAAAGSYRVRALTGRALAGLGDDGSARTELTAALAAFRELGARPDADEVTRLLEPAALPGGLTAREVEVLGLVASGRSNDSMAESSSSPIPSSDQPCERATFSSSFFVSDSVT